MKKSDTKPPVKSAGRPAPKSAAGMKAAGPKGGKSPSGKAKAGK